MAKKGFAVDAGERECVKAEDMLRGKWFMWGVGREDIENVERAFFPESSSHLPRLEPLWSGSGKEKACTFFVGYAKPRLGQVQTLLRKDVCCPPFLLTIVQE